MTGAIRKNTTAKRQVKPEGRPKKKTYDPDTTGLNDHEVAEVNSYGKKYRRLAAESLRTNKLPGFERMDEPCLRCTARKILCIAKIGQYACVGCKFTHKECNWPKTEEAESSPATDSTEPVSREESLDAPPSHPASDNVSDPVTEDIQAPVAQDSSTDDAHKSRLSVSPAPWLTDWKQLPSGNMDG